MNQLLRIINGYCFTEDVTQPATGGGFAEFPISYVRTGKWSRRCDKLFQKIFESLFAKRKGEILRTKPFNHDPSRHTDVYYLQLASPENFRTSFMLQYFRSASDHDDLHFVANPNLLTAGNFFWPGRLLAYLYKNFSVESDYRSIFNA